MMTSTPIQHTATSLKKKIDEIGRRIGGTPLLKLDSKLYRNPHVHIYAKKEWEQLSGSVKARAAFSIIRHAVETGQLTEKTILLDATSGNTGIAYAAIAREAGIRVTLCLPENASAERKQILQSLGAHIIFTSKFDGTDGAQLHAQQLVRENGGKYFYADQYKNDNNWKAHYYGTAEEIFNELPGITHFVAGLGTTGTFVGTGRRLKELNPSVKLVALQPDSALHGLEGWKHLETAIVPRIYDPSVADYVTDVTTEEAYTLIKKVRDTEGLLLSPSSAANIAGAIRIADTMTEGIIVTILPDNADKYSEVIQKIINQ